MSKQVVIFDGQELGIAVPLDGGMKFIAVRFNVIDLDNEIFNSVGDIRRAIAEHIASKAGKSDNSTAPGSCSPIPEPSLSAGRLRAQHFT